MVIPLYTQASSQMAKRKQKRVGKAPKCPPPQKEPCPASSSEEVDASVLRALLHRVEALEKEVADREAGSDDGGEASGVSTAPVAPLHCSTHPGHGNKVYRALSSRVSSLKGSPLEMDSSNTGPAPLKGNEREAQPMP